jgi:hypothetical protein
VGTLIHVWMSAPFIVVTSSRGPLTFGQKKFRGRLYQGMLMSLLSSRDKVVAI